MTNILFKIGRNCHRQFKCSYLKNEKHLLNFLFHFSIINQILNILKKRMIVIAHVFPKLQTVKVLVRPLCKKRCVMKRFYSQHVKPSQILPKSLWQQFFQVLSSFSERLISKMSPPVLVEVLWVFVNTVTAEGKYPVQDFENLPLPIQIQLSEKEKTFSQFLFHFFSLHQV